MKQNYSEYVGKWRINKKTKLLKNGNNSSKTFFCSNNNVKIGFITGFCVQNFFSKLVSILLLQDNVPFFGKILIKLNERFTNYRGKSVFILINTKVATEATVKCFFYY